MSEDSSAALDAKSIEAQLIEAQLIEAQLIEAEVIDAHESGDTARLAELYARAADLREAEGDVDGCCFFLVHARVFALEAGLDAAEELRRKLVARGRDS